MRWFEQVLSKPRWYLTQLHCPAMLKARNGNPAAAQAALFIIRSGHIKAAAAFILREGREQA